MEKKCIDCKYSRQCFTVKQVNPECCLKDRENEKKDEIKEIIDKLSKEENYIQHSYCRLFNYEANTLLDYITNLQEEIEQLKKERKTLYKYTPEKGFELVGDDNE